MAQTIIHLDSAKNNTGSIQNPSWGTDNPMLVDAKYVSVISMEFPNTMYNVTTSNRVLSIVNTSDAKTYTVTVPAGFYDATSLATYIQTYLLTQDAFGWTVTYSNTTGKFTIANTSAKNIYVDVPASSIAITMGFTVVQTGATSTTGNALSSLESQQFVYVYSNLTNCCILNGTSSSILHSMQLQNPFGSYCFYRAENPYPVLQLANPNISTVTMAIVDRNGNTINTNGKNWKISLAVWK